jgi:hypothetical protein
VPKLSRLARIGLLISLQNTQQIVSLPPYRIGPARRASRPPLLTLRPCGMGTVRPGGGERGQRPVRLGGSDTAPNQEPRSAPRQKTAPARRTARPRRRTPERPPEARRQQAPGSTAPSNGSQWNRPRRARKPRRPRPPSHQRTRRLIQRREQRRSPRLKTPGDSEAVGNQRRRQAQTHGHIQRGSPEAENRTKSSTIMTFKGR